MLAAQLREDMLSRNTACPLWFKSSWRLPPRMNNTIIHHSDRTTRWTQSLKTRCISKCSVYWDICSVICSAPPLQIITRTAKVEAGTDSSNTGKTARPPKMQASPAAWLKILLDARWVQPWFGGMLPQGKWPQGRHHVCGKARWIQRILPCWMTAADGTS